jgi:hypothetical protein
MPRTAPTLDAPFKKNEKVLTTRDLAGVPEGTRGRIKLINGLNTWIRYWVRFDNGAMMGQVVQNDLVRPAQLDAWHVRAEAQLNATEADVASDAEAPAAADAGGGAAGLIPAHLLERSKAAKARLLG